jgi:aryl-alcohol dehydrogenase-like predicted oxidoreductase
MNGTIPRRPLGKTGEQVSLLCVGGAHIGSRNVDEAVGIRIIHQAIDAGADFLDNAWEYNENESERRMGKALAQDGYRQKAFLMTKDCAHDRRADHSMQKLEESLRRLQTDYLDLWQIHEVTWPEDPDTIFAPGGSAEAMLKSKEQGKVRYVGFTGHKHPEIHRRMLSQGFPWDTVQMPLNALDAHFASFEREILPICAEQGIGVLGMKSFAAGHIFQAGIDITPQEALRYAMSLPVATVVSGMNSLEILEQNLAIARDFTPLTTEERAAILAKTAPVAALGRFEPFKTTVDYEGAEGRKAHNVPLRTAAAD